MSYMRKEDEKKIGKNKKERFLRIYANEKSRDPSNSKKQNDKKSK